jgi:hypothetical protein
MILIAISVYRILRRLRGPIRGADGAFPPIHNEVADGWRVRSFGWENGHQRNQAT